MIGFCKAHKMFSLSSQTEVLKKDERPFINISIHVFSISYQVEHYQGQVKSKCPSI